MENLISESEVNQQTEQTTVNEDQIHTGESPREYRNRLLRNIQSGDISSFDNHDRIHGALSFIDSIRDQYTGSARNINLVIRAPGDKHGVIGHKVHSISGGGTHVEVTPMAMGSAHQKTEMLPIKTIKGLQVSSYPNLRPEHRKVLERLMDFKGLREMYENKLNEEKEKKPYKGFKKGKNHPEGGLSRAEAKRQGIHAGIETKEEAKRKGGFGKLSGKTKKRRKSFCARMCGMKKRRTSRKTANDPKSKINAALRVWGCKCSGKSKKSLKEEFITMILEKKKMGNPCWKGYEAIGMKKKNGKKVPNCVPIKESTMNEIQLRVKEKFLSEGCGCGGGNKPKPKPKPTIKTPKNQIAEEVVNPEHQPMTKGEIKKRDKLKKKLGDVKIVKKGDTKENAKYRLATYITLLKKGKKKKKNKG